MSAKTKIVVFHAKELIYTGIFLVLGILFVLLLFIMFSPEKKAVQTSVSPVATPSYIPGVYTTSILLGDQTVDVEVVVDEDHISSVRLVNLDEAVTTLYPLVEPAFAELADQIYENQSLENITYQEENRYTSLLLLQAVKTSLDKASIQPTESTAT
ncbi:MAG: hypothetical protein PHP50_09870 [Lachnospiraceae bacterium]|nr:hypothetical protein [Lachnospiraceae bacterium]